MRPYWRHYYTGTQGVIFVVDSTDTDRMEKARMEFERVVTDDMLENVCVLVLANKQDVDGAMSGSEISEALDVAAVCKGHEYHVQETVATEGTGLEEGFMWLCSNMTTQL